MNHAFDVMFHVHGSSGRIESYIIMYECLAEHCHVNEYLLTIF